jgi:hypothetical protein
VERPDSHLESRDVARERLDEVSHSLDGELALELQVHVKGDLLGAGLAPAVFDDGAGLEAGQGEGGGLEFDAADLDDLALVNGVLGEFQDGAVRLDGAADQVCHVTVGPVFDVDGGSLFLAFLGEDLEPDVMVKHALEVRAPTLVADKDAPKMISAPAPFSTSGALNLRSASVIGSQNLSGPVTRGAANAPVMDAARAAIKTRGSVLSEAIFSPMIGAFTNVNRTAYHKKLQAVQVFLPGRAGDGVFRGNWGGPVLSRLASAGVSGPGGQGA